MTLVAQRIDSNSDITEPLPREELKTAVNALLEQQETDAALITTNSAIESFTAVSFTNSWANRSGEAAAAYYKDRSRAYIKGGIDSGTNATSAFTLPVGYRPSEKITITNGFITGATTTVRIVIDTDGTVTPSTGTSSGVSLNNISFRI